MLKVGKHCDFCKQNDFLPFQCRKCGKLCCLDHRDSHPCVKETQDEPIPEQPVSSRVKKVYKQPLSNPPASSAPKPAKTAEKQNALQRLKAYMAGKPQRSYKGSATKLTNTAETSGPKALGDESIPFDSRYFIQIRRPPHTTKDPLTGEPVTRPEKKVLVFYDKTKPIGHALDRAKQTLGVSSAISLQLNGTPLPSSSPIAGIPPGSTLDLV